MTFPKKATNTVALNHSLNSNKTIYKISFYLIHKK